MVTCADSIFVLRKKIPMGNVGGFANLIYRYKFLQSCYRKKPKHSPFPMFLLSFILLDVLNLLLSTVISKSKKTNINKIQVLTLIKSS